MTSWVANSTSAFIKIRHPRRRRARSFKADAGDTKREKPELIRPGAVCANKPVSKQARKPLYGQFSVQHEPIFASSLIGLRIIQGTRYTFETVLLLGTVRRLYSPVPPHETVHVCTSPSLPASRSEKPGALTIREYYDIVGPTSACDSPLDGAAKRCQSCFTR